MKFKMYQPSQIKKNSLILSKIPYVFISILFLPFFLYKYCTIASFSGAKSIFSHNSEIKKEIASVLTYLKDPEENPENEDSYDKVKRQASRSIPGWFHNKPKVEKILWRKTPLAYELCSIFNFNPFVKFDNFGLSRTYSLAQGQVRNLLSNCYQIHEFVCWLLKILV